MDDFEFDVRVFGEEFSQDRPEDGVSSVLDSRDPYRAGGLVAKFGQRRQLCLNLLEVGAQHSAAVAPLPPSLQRCA